MNDWPGCDCCGVTADLRAINITFSKEEAMEALCEFCQGLIDAGLIRREGPKQYRQWHMEWKPGKLVGAS